ncbi:MAG TPA: flagellar basal-body rod protein FlgF [Polyangiaceae bacterium LLY-WYZ-14_1]|nr:flagellar basal-body rod protein FlgF [Polyangiaceae bacterium LLY-WYZ-14_1]
MGDGIYSALSGAVAQQRSLDVVANNVANARTSAFRGDRVAFEEALAQQPRNPPEADELRFVAVARVQTDARSGSYEQTGNPLDLALNGDGFLAIETPQGERYVRAGSMVQDPGGFIVTQQGHRVLGMPPTPDLDPVPIRLPPEAMEVEVSPTGVVVADGIEVGTLRLVRFDEDNTVRKEGLNLFVGEAPLHDDVTEVMQGYLESSNVNAVAGMHELITLTRSFEALQKVIDTFRTLDDRAARDLGRRG